MGGDGWADGALDVFAVHGGDLAAARRLYPDSPEPWVDLSTGINPHAWPLPPFDASVWTRLPEPEALTQLEAAAARRYGADAGSVIAGPGSQALIQTIARLGLARGVGALGRTYGGHAEAWRAAGVDFATVERLEALDAFDAAVVVNPNNPDGRRLSRPALLALQARLAARGGLLIVDEAFADLEPEALSLAPALPRQRAIVLRSFGKTWGLAGLRLGFAIASPDCVGPLRAALGAWPVSGPAIAIGTTALADESWLAAMRTRLAGEASRLAALLAGAGATPLGGTSLFQLVAHTDAPRLFRGLLRHGVLARPFADAPDRLRFGLPGSEATWARLAAALADHA